jgi:hypothetical protein
MSTRLNYSVQDTIIPDSMLLLIKCFVSGWRKNTYDYCNEYLSLQMAFRHGNYFSENDFNLFYVLSFPN